MYYTNDQDKNVYEAEITITFKSKIYMDAYNIKNAQARIESDFERGELEISSEGTKTMEVCNLKRCID